MAPPHQFLFDTEFISPTDVDPLSFLCPIVLIYIVSGIGFVSQHEVTIYLTGPKVNVWKGLAVSSSIFVWFALLQLHLCLTSIGILCSGLFSKQHFPLCTVFYIVLYIGRSGLM